MGLKELERNKQTNQTISTTQNKVADPSPQVYAPQQTTQVQQSSPQAQDELTAWAMCQQGYVALPTNRIFSHNVTEKRMFKSPKVTAVYKREDFQTTRANELRDKIPQLYEQDGTKALIDEASKEIDLTLKSRLTQAKDPALQLLSKLNSAQKTPDGANLEELRQEMAGLRLTTGEERIPLEDAFTKEELLVLMTANLCRHLQERMASSSIPEMAISSAKTAIDSLSHTSNIYANLIVGKVTTRSLPIIERKAREAQEREAAVEREKRAAAAERDNENRRVNTARVDQFLARVAKDISDLVDEAYLQKIKKELLPLMEGVMTRDLLDDETAQGEFQLLLEENLINCQSYNRVIHAEAAMSEFLDRQDIAPELRRILCSDKRFLAGFLGENGEAITLERVTQMTQAIADSKTVALARLSSTLPQATPEEREAMVEKLSQEMPHLLLGGSTLQLNRQMDMMVRYRSLTAPQASQKMTTTKGDALPTTPPSSSDDIAGEILSAFKADDALFDFLPDLDAHAHLEQAILLHLGQKKLAEDAKSILKKKDTLGRNALDEMDALSRREFITAMVTQLRERATLAKVAFKNESSQLRERMLGDLIAGASIEEMGNHAKQLREHFKRTKDLDKHSVALKVLSPISTDSEKMTTDFRNGKYNSAAWGKGQLRSTSRFERMDDDLKKHGLQNPGEFRSFIVEALGNSLHEDGIHAYTKNLKDIIKHINDNQALADNTLNAMAEQGHGLDAEYKRIRTNLRPLITSQTSEEFAQTLTAIQNSFADQNTSWQLRTYTRAQNTRFYAICQEHPKLSEQDVRAMFTQKGDMEAMCSYDDGQWAEFAQERLSKVSPLLDLIDYNFSYIKDLPDQLRLVFHDQIYSGSLTLNQAKKDFQSHYDSLVTQQFSKSWFSADKSLDESIRTLLEKSTANQATKDVLSSYLLFLLSECNLTDVLELEKVWAEREEAITQRVVENDALIHSTVAAYTNGFEPKVSLRLTAGFILRMRRDICTKDKAELEAILEDEWGSFLQHDAVTQLETKATHETMAQRVTVLREVETHRKASVALLQKEEKKRESLFALQTGQTSLFSSVVKTPPTDWDRGAISPGTKTLNKLQKAEKKANPDSDQPSPMVTELLAEYLSFRKDYKEILKSDTKLKLANNRLAEYETALRAHCKKVGIGGDEVVGKTVTLTLSLFAQGGANGLALFESKPMDSDLPEAMLMEHLRRDNLVFRTAKELTDTTRGELLGLDSLTVTTEEFDKALKKTVEEDKITAAATAMAKEYLATTQWSEVEQTALLRSWLIYRHKDCMEQGVKHFDALRTMAQTDLSNPDLVNILLSVSNRDVHASYYEKGSMAALGSTTLSKKEQAGTTLTATTREAFESWIATNASQSQQEKYSALSREGRQLFAFGLSMPSHLLGIAPTTTGKLAKSVTPDVGGELATQSLQRFLLMGDTKGMDTLDYGRSIAGLTATKSILGLRDKIFDSAMAFSAFCLQARREAIPPDAQRLCDAKASIEVAGKAVPDDPCQTIEELRTFLLKDSSGLPSALQDKIKGCDENKLLLLVNILQNRTLLDRTCTSTEKDRDYVDPDGREAMVNNYSTNLSQVLMSQSSNVDTIEGAFMALHSYQIQDGLELGDRLHKSDLSKESYERKTALDLSLLTAALETVDQIFAEDFRLHALSYAPDLILQSKNEKAIKAYGDFKDHVTEEGHFTAFIKAQVESQLGAHMDKPLSGDDSELLGLYSAYLSFTPKERHLFFKAMGSRDVLDISKKNIGANRFGFKNRDYANPVGRNALLDEYATTGDVVEQEASIQRAFASLLSTQVSDKGDMEGDMAEKMTSSRETAVDWKLFKRAIQLVRRATNERDTRNGQFELYVSTGTVHKEGSFHFESDFLRRNVHNAGNRLTRFLGRRVAAQTVGRVSEYLGDQVSDNLCNLLGSKVSDMVEGALSPEEKEEQQELSKARQLELSSDFTSIIKESRDPEVLEKLGVTNDAIADVAEFASSSLLETVSNIASPILEVGEHAVNIYHGAVGITQLKTALKESAGAQLDDLAVQEQAMERQTDAQQARFARAKGKVTDDMGQATDLAKKRQVDAITEGVGEIVCSVLSIDALDGFPVLKIAGEVLNEAMKIVNFARSAFDEKKIVDRNLEANKLWTEKKAGLAQNFTQIGQREAKTYDFALASSGFENMTEYASAKGMDFVQSLLFSASKFNNLPSTKILALTILKVLKFEKISEDYHTLNANLVFDRLMGGKNR